MGVYIKGMGMPTRCFSCPMCDVENAEVNCAVSHGSYIEYREVNPKVAIQERPSWCPLIEITSHGRLGDLDEAEKKIVRLFNYSADRYSQDNVDGYEDGLIDAQNAVRNIPTILPASEVE